MISKFEQDQINKEEWNNPDNWSGPKLMEIYYSKKDSRTWVPKRVPYGWCQNLGKKSGVAWMWGIMIALQLFTILLCTFIILQGR